MSDLATLLAPHRLLLAERDQWAQARVAHLDGAVLLAREGASGDLIAAHGPGPTVLDLLDSEARGYYRAGAHGAMWLTAPRSARVPAWVLDTLQLAPVTEWDWMSTVTVPDVDTTHVEPLASHQQAAEIHEVLRVANPRSTADPLDESEAAWFGVREDSRLVGVIGARGQLGDPAGADRSWHLHGLAVLPESERHGLGTALTAAAVQAGLADGADWVSLGLYADNDAARRIYHRLGFQTDAEMASYAAPAIARR